MPVLAGIFCSRLRAIAVMPDDQAQNAVTVDLASARFRAGVGRGQWKQVSYAFPVLVVAVAAIEPEGKTGERCFRFELSGFPGTAPEVKIWDPATNASLAADKRSKGSERVKKAFQVRGDNIVYRP